MNNGRGTVAGGHDWDEGCLRFMRRHLDGNEIEPAKRSRAYALRDSSSDARLSRIRSAEAGMICARFSGADELPTTWQ